MTSLTPGRGFYLGLAAFDACVADNGVLTSFGGAGDGGTVGVELTTFTETADPTVFQPPAGYLVVGVERLIGTSASPSASPTGSPSASAVR